MMILSDYDRMVKVSKFCGKIITSLPSFFVQKSLFKIVFGQNFLIVNRFSKFLQHNFGQTKRQIFQRKYFAYS